MAVSLYPSTARGSSMRTSELPARGNQTVLSFWQNAPNLALSAVWMTCLSMELVVRVWVQYKLWQRVVSRGCPARQSNLHTVARANVETTVSRSVATVRYHHVYDAAMRRRMDGSVRSVRREDRATSSASTIHSRSTSRRCDGLDQFTNFSGSSIPLVWAAA